MLVRSDLWLFAAGLVASSVNAAAGGGTLLSFPSLLAAGLSPLTANATSTVGLVPGFFGSMAGYRAELRGDVRRDVVRTAIPSLLGGVLGAWLLIALGGAFFTRIAPWLLLTAAALLLLNPLLSKKLASHRAIFDHPAAAFAANFTVAVYSGYFGAGAGILFLASMSLLYSRPFNEVNVLKIIASLLANLIAATTFVVLELSQHSGALVFRDVLPLAAGALVGGYAGVRVARRLPPAVLRGFAASVGVAIALVLAFRRR